MEEDELLSVQQTTQLQELYGHNPREAGKELGHVDGMGRPCLLGALLIRTGQKAAVCPTLAIKAPLSTLSS